MVLPNTSFGANGIIVFADGAVHPDPNEKELAEIAVATARTAKAIGGFEPRVAIVTFSTKGSAKHPMVDKVINATRIAQEMAPELLIDGELQIDAALVRNSFEFINRREHSKEVLSDNCQRFFRYGFFD